MYEPDTFRVCFNHVCCLQYINGKLNGSCRHKPITKA